MDPHSSMSVPNPPAKRLMLYDGDCGFCRRWISRWRKMTRGEVDYASYQEAASRFPEISREDLARSVFLIEPDGAVVNGARAVFRSVVGLWYLSWLDRLYRYLPGFATLSEKIYRWVTDHRRFF